jgi:hypothetical protein
MRDVLDALVAATLTIILIPAVAVLLTILVVLVHH